MICRLYTAAKEHVADVDIPPFNEPPHILVWGERFFKLDQYAENFVMPEYTEAFTFFVPGIITKLPS